MLPINIETELVDEHRPTRTYKVLAEEDRIDGYTDGRDAIAQTAYIILATERYKHVIYSWDYGVELQDLIGMPIPYVKAVLPERIRDALITDDRILDVSGFEFEEKRHALLVSCILTTVVGEIGIETEVKV